MKTKIIFFISLLLINFAIKAQTNKSFSAPLQQLQKGKNLIKSNQINAYLFDSLYFYRSDFEDFQTTAEYRNIMYKSNSDTLEKMNIYTNSNIPREESYFLSHYATYRYYKSTTDNNSFIEEIYYDVNNDEEQFFSKTIFEYDENKRLLSSTEQIYSLIPMDWVDNTKYVFFYTDDNKIDKIETYWGTRGWDFLFYEQYYYNSIGNIDYIERIGENKILLNKRIYNYNSNNLVTSIEDEVNNVVQYSVDFTYDENGNITSRETSSGFKYTYEYDENIDIEDVGGPFNVYFESYMIEFIKHPIIQCVSYQYIDGWQPSTKIKLIYKGETINVKDVSDDNILIYPNPVTQDQLYIVLKDNEYKAQVSIFDNQGRMVMQKNINSNTSINVSSLSSGVYFVKTKSEKNTYTNKIIIN